MTSNIGSPSDEWDVQVYEETSLACMAPLHKWTKKVYNDELRSFNWSTDSKIVGHRRNSIILVKTYKHIQFKSFAVEYLDYVSHINLIIQTIFEVVSELKDSLKGFSPNLDISRKILTSIVKSFV